MPNNLPKPGDILNKSSLPKPSDVLEQVKKKEATPAPKKKDSFFSSATKMVDASLATSKPKTAQKPSVSSGGKAKQQVFTGYPGKEDKKYILDESTGKQIWNEYSTTEFKNGKQIEKYEKPITDPARVAALNKQFNQNAGASDTEEVFVGFPGKETNKYRVYNGNWERMQPTATKWTTLTDATAITALNNQYKKKVKIPTVLQNTVEENTPKFADINSKLISNTEEKVVPYLQNKYGNLGFSFEQSGMGTDYVTVTAKNGNTMEIGLDESNPTEALKLRTFLDLNKSDKSTKNNNIKELRQKISDIPLPDGSLSDSVNKARNSAIAEGNKKLNEYLKSDQYVDDFKSLDFYSKKKEIDIYLNDLRRNRDTAGNTGNQSEINKAKDEINNFYNSNIYKIYKKDISKQLKDRTDQIDKLYYSLKQAKTADQKKVVKQQIDSYLSNNFIQDQTNNYNIQLNDVSNSSKKIAAETALYQKDLNAFNQKVNSGQINKEQYDSMSASFIQRAEDIDNKNSEIKKSGNAVVSEMKKLETVAGKYLLTKEKIGGFWGNMLNSTVNGVSKIIEFPVGLAASYSGDLDYEMLDPQIKNYLKDKKYSKEESINYLANKRQKEVKEGVKSSLIETLGTSSTTEEYRKSADRGFFEKALAGVAESLPAMLVPGGAAARISALGTQAYSSIEDEMLNDKDFETTSVKDRSIIAVPYAIGMGILENIGVTIMMSKNPLAKSLIAKSLLSVAGKIGGDTTEKLFKNILEKEIKSNIAKFGLRVIGGTLAEAETGASQSLLLDIGMKKLYNLYKDKTDGKLATELSQGEYFDTPDSFSEGASMVLEDAAAEAIGGMVMSSATTSYERIRNGNINLYNARDVDFLKSIAEDSEIKKIFIAKLKTQMLSGKITKSEAQNQLDAMNDVQGLFKKIPDNITGENLKSALTLTLERNKLEKEIEGKDVNLVATQKARVAEINNELTKISEDATKESNVQEVTTEGGTVEYQGTGEGQQEVGVSEGSQRETTQPGTDRGDSVVAGEVQQEEVTAKNKETEAKIKNKGLFLAEVDENGNKVGESVGEIISQSNVAPIATSVREIGGYEFVEFSNPETGEVDVIVTGDTNGNYVGFYRLYDNGKPTNKWSSKMNSKDKNAFKTMMSGVQEILPQGHEYSEKTSISTDGLRVWNQQLQRGYELQYDNNGNLITDTVAINGDALVNELGIDVNQGDFDNISVTNETQFNKVKKALLPYLQKFGLNENNINWDKNNSTVTIDLPVLRKKNNTTQQTESTTEQAPQQTEVEAAQEEVTPGERAIVSGVEIVYPTEEQKAERIAARSTAEFVETSSQDLPIEDINILSEELGGEFGLLTAENPLAQPLTDQENKSLTQKALKWLESRGYNPRRVTGKYGQGENSLFVPNLSKEDAIAFAIEFNQESVAHSEGLVYQDGSMNPRVKEDDDLSFSEFSPESDMVSVIRTPDGLKTFSIGYDFENKVPASKAPPTIEQEVEAIGQLLSGTDAQIDQKATKIVNKKIAKTVARAAKAVSNIIPGTKFVVHDTDESYRAATKEEGLKQSSNGEFNAKTNTIHINGTSANNRTVAHEVFHAILINKVKTDKNAADVTKRMIESISPKVSTEINKKLNDFISNYEENIQNEEKLAELVGIFAENYNSFSTSVKDIITRWINKLAGIFGLDPFNSNETYDMLKTIAKKVAKGKEISEADVNPLIEGVVGEISVSENVANRKSIAGEIIRFDVNKNTKVEENIPLSRFNGKKTNVFESDRMTGGYIASDSGAVLFNFLGGVNFPAITGKWWASKNETKASNLAKNANANRDADGYIYGTPMVGSDKQHMSNNDMLVATLELMKLDASSTKTKINKLEVIRLINKAFETKNIKLKKPILVDVIKKSNNVSNIFSELEYVLFQDGKYIVDRNNNPILDDNGSSVLNLTFEDRKAIVETLLGNASVRDVNFPSAGNAFEAAKRFEEPLTEKAKKIGDVVTVMRTKGALKWKKTEATDEFYHKSYPYEIYAENQDGTVAEIEMFILDSAYSMRDIFPSLTKSSGESFTWDEYFEKHGPKSDKVAEAQYNRTAKLSYASGEITASNRKQLAPEVSSKLTEDKSGNFVFHHYSNDKRNTIKPGTGQNIITGQEEGGALSAVGGLAMYYTMDNQVEPGVGNILHTVLVPNGKVYDFNQDPENFYDEAKKRFEAARPSQSFSPNYQLAFITQVANENGYDMVVARWRNNELRAQTTMTLDASKGNVPMKAIAEETYKVGDDVEVYGAKGKITSIDGDMITFKGDGVGGAINFKRFPKEISKQITPRKQIAEEVVGIEETISPRKQKPKSINDIVKLTKDQGFSDAAIRQYLKDQGYSEKNINDAIEPEKNRMFNEAEGVFEKSQDRGRDTKEALQNSIDYIQTSLWYENATDIEREQAIRDFRKYKSQKEKAAPSIAKVLGTQKPETVTMFIKTLRNEFIKAKAQAANIAVRDIKNKQRSIVVAINQMKRQGSISAAQAASLAKRLAYLNVDNPVMVSRYLEYAERLFNNADYQEQLSKAFKLRKSIRRVLKNNQAQVAGMAKDFTNIDPSMMDDVQSYIENAEKIMSALKRSVSDTKFVLKEAVNISEMNQFTEDAIEAQDAKIKKEKLAEYQDLVDQGIISEDMELKDIIEVIKSIEGTEIKDKQKKEAELRKYVNKMFDFYSTYINRMLKDGAVDQFSGEELTIDEKSKAIIKKVIAIDINEMSLSDAYNIVESINNFIVNGITDGLEASVRKFNGAKNASDFAKTGIKAKALRVLFIKGISRIQARLFTTLPVLIDRMFGGVRTGLQFTKAMGLNEFENGVAKADTVHTKIVDEYGKEFSKKNMLGRLVWKMSNGEAFNSAMNTYERGMLAYLKRTLIGTDLQQQKELKRRISLIKESINTLKIDGDEKQKKMGKIYEELFNKLGLEESNPNILDIESRVDPTNRAAVKWWTDKWSEHYSDLYDVSLAVYNTQLGKDLNYTPDRYSKINNETFLLDSNEGMGSFGLDLGLVTDKNKSGVLMESNKNFGTLINKEESRNTRFVNLDFDMSNSNSMKAALIDINTAAPIVQIASFMNSKAMNKIIELQEDREMLKTRINNYITQSKHKSFTTDKSFNEANKFLDSISAIGTAKALGTVMAPLLQTVPVLMNTIINTGRTLNLFDLVSDRDYNKWLSSSGMPIANRGLESSSQISSGNKYLEKVANSKGAQLTSAIRDLNKFYLKNFLAKPDVYIARASWKAYYIKDLKRQGIDTRGIDWDTHKKNQDAADYAQHMVDRQQNVSDPMLMGEFMSSSDSTKKAIRKIVLPFANFILNQKTRMASDLRTLSSSTSIKEDKIAAAKSMTGLLVEIAAFNAMGAIFKNIWGAAAASLMGYDEPEEEKEKRDKYTDQQFGVNIIKDLLSPFPLLDGVTVAVANEITSKIQDLTYSKEDLKLAVDERNTYLESRDKDPMDAKTEKEFRQQWIDEQKLNFEQYNSEKFISAGSLTIMLDKAIEFKELVEVASTGKYTKEYNGNEVEKILLPEDQKKLDLAVWLDGLYLAGLLPREGGTIAKKMLKVAENRGLTESQYEEYKAIKKATGDVDGYKLDLMKSTMSIDNVITEIEWVENNGGLTKEQSKVYTKVRYILKDVDAQTLKKIQRGMTAEQITK